jgi:hypothetical protein
MGVDAQDLIGGGFGSLRIVLREDLDRTEEVVWNGGAGKLASWVYLNQKGKRTSTQNFLDL